MRWIRRRRGASGSPDTSQVPEAPKRPVGAWRDADPAMRVSAEPPTAGSARFVKALPTRWQQAPILGPLGHDVTLDGPSGLMPDVARTVDPLHGERPEFVWPGVRKPRVAGARRARAVGPSAAVSRSAWPTPLRKAAVVAGDVEGPVARPRVSVVEDGGATQAAPTSVAESEGEPDFEDSSEADTAAVDETSVEVPPALPITNPKPVSAPEVRGRARRTRLGPPIEPASPDVRDVMSDPETEVSEGATSKQVPQSLLATTTYSPVSTIDGPEAAPEVSGPSPTMSTRPLRQVPVVRAAERKVETRPDDSVLETEHDAPPVPTGPRPADIAPIVSRRQLFAPLQSISVAAPPSRLDQSTPVGPANQSSAFAQALTPQASPVPAMTTPNLTVATPPRRTLVAESTRFVASDGPSAPQQIPSIPSAVPASPALSQTALSASPRPALSASPAPSQTALSASPPAPLQSFLRASTQPVSSASLRSGLSASPALPQPAASSASPRPGLSASPAPSQPALSASSRPGSPASPAPSQPASSASHRLDFSALSASPQSALPALAQTAPPAPFQSASPAPTQLASLPAPSPPTPAASADPFALDQLAADLYDRLRSRLVDELYVGRERAQLLTDL